MYTAPGIITLIVAALVGTVVGNLVQLRYFVSNPVMKSPFVRYGSLVLAIVIMLNIIPDPEARFTTTELMSYGLWWVLIAFFVSFVRPPVPIPPRKGRGSAAAEGDSHTADLQADSEAAELESFDTEPDDHNEPGEHPRDER